MPVVLRVKGIAFHIYFNEKGQHRGAHVHILWAGDKEASVSLTTLERFEGDTLTREIRELLEEHKEYLRGKWNEYNP